MSDPHKGLGRVGDKKRRRCLGLERTGLNKAWQEAAGIWEQDIGYKNLVEFFQGAVIKSCHRRDLEKFKAMRPEGGRCSSFLRA